MSTIEFNGITKDFLSVGRDWSLPAWAPIERGYEDLPGGVGSIQTNVRTGRRQFSLPVVIHSKSFPDKEKFVEEMALWLLHKGAKPLKLSKYPGRTLYAVVEGTVDFPEMWTLGKGTLTIVCADPYKKGESQTENFVAGKVNLINVGTAASAPVFKVRFTAARTNLEISNNNQTFRLIRNFGAGDQLVIDCRRQLVQLNGADSMPIRDWRTPFKRLLLQPGQNVLNVGSGVEVTMEYIEQYL